MVSVGLASIINGMTPLFTALVMASFREERLTIYRVVGVLLGVAGVVLISRPDAAMADAQLLGIGLCLAAALSYGFAALWGRRHLADLPPLKSATCQLLSSTLIMTVVVAIVDRPWTLPMPSTEVWMALCGLALFGTAIAYVVFFEILTRAGASNVMLVTLLIRTPPVKTAPPVGCIRHDFGDRRRAGGVVVGSWRAARGRRLCGQGLLPVRLPVPGEKFVQTGLRQVGDTVEDIGEPGLRVDVVELRGADERVHHRSPHAAAVGTREQPRFASETDAAQRPLGGVCGATIWMRAARQSG